VGDDSGRTNGLVAGFDLTMLGAELLLALAARQATQPVTQNDSAPPS
jgi:hypothetical protein